MVGLSNGLSLLMDKETRSLWDHMTGVAFDGPLSGRALEMWPITITTFKAELKDFPQTLLFTSNNRSIIKKISILIARATKIFGKGFLPPHFYFSMNRPIDERLPKLTQGLGVISGGRAKYYPLGLLDKDAPLDDRWEGRTLRITRGEIDGVPHAVWLKSSEQAMQILSRWYGFSFSYPGCEIYESVSRD